jgi:hypothetical protein
MMDNDGQQFSLRDGDNDNGPKWWQWHKTMMTMTMTDDNDW